MISSKIYAVEGIDGCGKSTLLHNILNSESAPFTNPIVVRELSATETGRLAAQWVHSHDITSNKKTALEALKYLSDARDAAMEEVTLPHLKSGGCVFYDRFVATTWVYQAFNEAWKMDEVIREHIKQWQSKVSVSSTVFLDISPCEVTRRMHERASQGGVVDPNDLKSADYYQKLRERFINTLTVPGVIPFELLGELIYIHANADTTPAETLDIVLRTLGDHVSEVPPVKVS